jgi:hypothetical protein
MRIFESLFHRSQDQQDPALTGEIIALDQEFDINRFLPKEALCVEPYDHPLSRPSLIRLGSKFRITLVNYGDEYVDGHTRIRSQYTRGRSPVGAQGMKFLWENRDMIPEFWKSSVDGRRMVIYFDGTPFKQVGSDKTFSLFLRHDGSDWRKGLECHDLLHRKEGRGAVVHLA